jgi:hypothetical protein
MILQRSGCIFFDINNAVEFWHDSNTAAKKQPKTVHLQQEQPIKWKTPANTPKID